jgi:hypothetical protein
MSAPNQYPDFSGLTFEKVWAAMMETDKKILETSRNIDRLEETVHETSRSLNESLNRLEQSQKNMQSELGGLGNRFGDVIEHLVLPGVMHRFNELGFHFDDTTENFRIFDKETNKTLTELDIVLENGETIIVVEVKVDPSVSDVKKHLKKLEIYRNHLNRKYASDHRKIYGAIAAAVFPPKVQEAALEAGFYVIVQSGDTVKIDVPEGFMPTAF